MTKAGNFLLQTLASSQGSGPRNRCPFSSLNQPDLVVETAGIVQSMPSMTIYHLLWICGPSRNQHGSFY